MAEEERFLWFGLHLNQFSSPVVNTFIKAEKKQTLGDIVVLADHTNNHDKYTVAIKASKSLFPFFFFFFFFSSDPIFFLKNWKSKK